MQHDEWLLDCSQLAATDTCLATLTSRTADGTTTTTQSVTPSSETYRGWSLPACDARHLWLHRGEPDTERAVFVQHTPLAARAPGYTFALTVLHDPALAPRGPSRPEAGQWFPVPNGHRVALTPDGDGGTVVAFDVAGDLLHHGGPMIGIGGRVSDAGAFRLRLEYEVAIDEWILPGLALDYDFDDGFVLTPRVEIATPVALVIPSLNVGLGLPMRLQAAPELGVQLSVGLSFLSLGFIATFDIYPGPETIVDSTLMFRFSL